VKEFKNFYHTILYSLHICWKAAKGYAVSNVIVQVANALLPFATIVLTKQLIDKLTLSAGILDLKIMIILICLGAVNLTQAILSKVSDYMQTMQESLLQNYLNQELIKKKLEMDIQYFDSPKYQNILHSVEQDIYALNSVIWNAIQFVGAMVTLGGAWILLSRENILYCFAITLTILPSVISNQKYIKILYTWSLEQSPKERHMGYIRWISGERVFSSDVRLFNLKNILLKKYCTIWKTHFSSKRTVLKKKTVVTLIFNMLPEVASVFILILLVKDIISGLRTIGDYTLYIGLLTQLTGGLFLAIQTGMSVYGDKLKIDTLQKFNQYRNSVEDIGEEDLVGPVSIEFKDVTFKYPDTDTYVLKRINFKVTAGEKICLVGINGSGKSTIIKLMLRFYDVTDGCILLNGLNIQKYKIESLRKQFSTLFQEYVSYSFSLKENIIISDFQRLSNDQEIINVLRQAGAVHILNQSPDGLDSYVTKFFSERGIELSGGERQKIALARTLYRTCSVVFFDEPSAALDPEAEHVMYENIRSLWTDKTAFYTSHRLSAVHLADRVMLLQNGVITEQGTHKELMLFNGEYSRIYHIQADKYQLGI
jgi:ABC-type multidrug transport system fused ATPase/permease subunit